MLIKVLWVVCGGGCFGPALGPRMFPEDLETAEIMAEGDDETQPGDDDELEALERAADAMEFGTGDDGEQTDGQADGHYGPMSFRANGKDSQGDTQIDDMDDREFGDMAGAFEADAVAGAADAGKKATEFSDTLALDELEANVTDGVDAEGEDDMDGEGLSPTELEEDAPAAEAAEEGDEQEEDEAETAAHMEALTHAAREADLAAEKAEMRRSAAEEAVKKAAYRAAVIQQQHKQQAARISQHEADRAQGLAASAPHALKKASKQQEEQDRGQQP